jgi:hypothetical protein
MPYASSDPTFRYEILAGQLYRHGPNHSQRVRPWGPNAGCWTRPAGMDWQSFTPGFRVPHLEEIARATVDVGEVHAARFLLSAWPRSACDAVRELPGRHWDPLQLINVCGQAGEELLVSHPALGVLLSARRQLAPHSRRFDDPAEVRLLALSRRREIAAEFGFPKAESTVRLLAKISREFLDVDTLRLLRSTLWRDEAAQHRLSRLTVLTPADLQLACERVLPRPEKERPWPRSPLPETPDIRPITSAEELQREGRKMHHCAGGYVRRAARGECFFYRVVAPERATLAIERGPRGWRILDLKAVCNRKPSAATLRTVQAWLGGPAGRAQPRQLSFDFGSPA